MAAPRYRFSPASLRPLLVLEAVSEMVTAADWPYKQVRMTLPDQGAEALFSFSLFGGEKPSTIEEVGLGSAPTTGAPGAWIVRDLARHRESTSP